MNITGIGVDIVNLERVRKARYLDRVAEFLFTEEELKTMAESRDKAQFVASRLAAKESVIKAFPETRHYHDFLIIKKEGKVSVECRKPEDLHRKVFLSITHELDYTIGYAIVCE
jgi:phosphopantetheine--protein transferase-like protein